MNPNTQCTTPIPIMLLLFSGTLKVNAYATIVKYDVVFYMSL